MKRLASNSQEIRLNFQLEHTQVYDYCNELISYNEINNCGIRITYSKGRERNNLIITCRENPYTEEMITRGFALMTSSVVRNETSPLVRIKSNNYLDNLLNLNYAKDKGYNEVLYYNTKGFLAEGSMSNIFFVKSDKLLTPAVKNGLLSGIIRDKVIHIANTQDIPLEEGYYKKHELSNADEIFVTNSLMEIMPIRLLDNKEFEIRNDSMTKYLIERYKKHND